VCSVVKLCNRVDEISEYTSANPIDHTTLLSLAPYAEAFVDDTTNYDDGSAQHNWTNHDQLLIKNGVNPLHATHIQTL
ncbi:MAG: hypothetical protein KDK65_03585, partial [Chlamydiia bacterium]|nr:hypothetical protein [Chlamydiia bacterium]